MRSAPHGLGRFSFPRLGGCRLIHLLYVDESGDPDNPLGHFVLGGLALHESDVDPFRRRVEGIVRKYLHIQLRELELHAHSIRTGRNRWRGIPRDAKTSILADLSRLLGSYSSPHGFALFTVIRAPGAVPHADPLQRTYEELLLRFNELLKRLSHVTGTPQFGIVVADRARYELIVQPIVSQWRTTGTRFGRLKHIVDVPLFVDSKATRLIQLADMVAYASYRYYEAGDDLMLGRILRSFDTDQGVIHGLVHLVRNHRHCPCPACVSRIAASEMQGPRSV